MRVLCRVTHKVTEFALVEWFPAPSYPDGDPLVVKIDLSAEPPSECDPILLLDDIDPTPVMYEVHNGGHGFWFLFMMRIRGLDIVPPSDP